jgi:hypothetical protein
MLVALMVLGVGLLVGCKKKVEPTAKTAGTMTTTEEPPTTGTGHVPPTGGTGVHPPTGGTGVGTGGG